MQKPAGVQADGRADVPVDDLDGRVGVQADGQAGVPVSVRGERPQDQQQVQQRDPPLRADARDAARGR